MPFTRQGSLDKVLRQGTGAKFSGHDCTMPIDSELLISDALLHPT